MKNVFLLITFLFIAIVAFVCPSKAEALKVSFQPSISFHSTRSAPPRPVYTPPYYEVQQFYDPYEGYYDMYYYHPGHVQYVRQPARSHVDTGLKLNFRFR